MQNIGVVNTLIKTSESSGASELLYMIAKSRLQDKYVLVCSKDIGIVGRLFKARDKKSKGVFYLDSADLIESKLMKLGAFDGTPCMLIIDDISNLDLKTKKGVLALLDALGKCNNITVLASSNVDLASRSLDSDVLQALGVFSYVYDLYKLNDIFILEDVRTHERELLPISDWMCERVI